MNNAHPDKPKLPQKWSPVDRKLWLTHHGAPSNFVLMTTLELQVVTTALQQERQARLALQSECETLITEKRDLINMINEELTTLERVVEGLDPEEQAQLQAKRERVDAITNRKT